MRGARWAGGVSLSLIAAGVAGSGYLFARTLALRAGRSNLGDFCSTLFEASCDHSLISGYSNLFGLPVAAWGVVYFVTLGALVISGVLQRELLLQPAFAGALLLNLAGLGVSGYYSSLFVVANVPLCPLCVQVHLVNLALFPTLLVGRGGGLRGLAASVKSAALYLMRASDDSSRQHTAIGLAFICVALVAAVTYQWLLLRMTPSAKPDESLHLSAEDMLALYFAQPKVDIPNDENSPRTGSIDAALRLVVFSDFECPACAANARTLERLVESFGNRLSVTYKHFPLNAACNSAAAGAPHASACQAAYAAEAAHLQGKFVAFHNLLFRSKADSIQDAIEQSAVAAGLTLDTFRRDVASGRVQARIAADVELGIRLKVDQTPYLFLNDRAIPSQVLPNLAPLLSEVMKSLKQPTQ